MEQYFESKDGVKNPILLKYLVSEGRLDAIKYLFEHYPQFTLGYWKLNPSYATKVFDRYDATELAAALGNVEVYEYFAAQRFDNGNAVSIALRNNHLAIFESMVNHGKRFNDGVLMYCKTDEARAFVSSRLNA